jgi:FtsP/CotA-like multicopper oxidase with cupredoxin domain
MHSRRSFLAYTGGTTLALFTYGKFGIKEAIAQIPGGSLDPLTVPKFQTAMLVPPAMPRAKVLFENWQWIDYYEISMRQFTQQILPGGFPATTVWGYGPADALNPSDPKIYNAPSLTIEARAGVPVRIKWINELKDANGRYLPHLLPVDPTLHWANPPGGTAGRDTRPSFASTPGPYMGPVPMVTHVHGAVGVGDESDGYAEAWFLPDANNIPGAFATEGTWYGFFKVKAKNKFGVDWGPGYAISQYPNSGRASIDWYHDHTLGMTRLNVYAGPAGFYNIRGGPDGDLAVRKLVRGRQRLALLPGPAPTELTQIVGATRFYDIPIAIQDRSFNIDGSLFYPDSRAFFDGVEGPYLPNTDLSPIWNPEFFGNMIMVNGNTWPYLEVEPRRFRFRFLNGCQSRFLILDFNALKAAGAEVWQIGNEGGFLAAPVNLTGNGVDTTKNRLLMSLAERADLIFDFSNVPIGAQIELGNVGPDEPFKGFNPDGSLTDGQGGTLDPADPGTTGKIMKFIVGPLRSLDLSTPAAELILPAIAKLPAPSVTRRLALIEEMSAFFEDSPAEALLGVVGANGKWTKKLWMDAVTENPVVGAVEVWEIYNTTGDAHPMHVHETVFEVVNRQAINIDESTETVSLVPNTARPAEAWETGFKDTVIAYPGEVTRIKARFTSAGQYTWHCHIVEHEDNEMMRPYRIGPVQAGQPGSM